MDSGFVNFSTEYAGIYGQTMLHPAAAAMLLAAAIGTLALPRRYAFVPMLALLCFVTPAQRVIIASLDFTLLRLIILFGLMRVLARGELRKPQWQLVDWLVLWYVIAMFLVSSLRGGDTSGMIRAAGIAFDTLGLFLLVRAWVLSLDDIRRLVTTFAVLAIPVSLAFIVESQTARNLFAVFGGVPEVTIVRSGRLRCQGAFAHPILAGTFWATLLPLFIALAWSGRRYKVWSIIGSVATVIIVVAAASSTPVASLAAAIFAMCMFRWRRELPVFRWVVVGALVVIHFIREMPVWHLISRVDIVGGSTGHQRYRLIDGAIRHIGEWALLGTNQTAHWDYGTYDVAVEYVGVAVRGGLLGLGLHVAIIAAGFIGVGRACERLERRRADLLLAWGVGAALFTQCVSMIGTSYWGQMIFSWNMCIALVALAGSRTALPSPAQRVAARRPRNEKGQTIALSRRLAHAVRDRY